MSELPKPSRVEVILVVSVLLGLGLLAIAWGADTMSRSEVTVVLGSNWSRGRAVILTGRRLLAYGTGQVAIGAGFWMLGAGMSLVRSFRHAVVTNLIFLAGVVGLAGGFVLIIVVPRT